MCLRIAQIEQQQQQQQFLPFDFPTFVVYCHVRARDRERERENYEKTHWSGMLEVACRVVRLHPHRNANSISHTLHIQSLDTAKRAIEKIFGDKQLQ